LRRPHWHSSWVASTRITKFRGGGCGSDRQLRTS
jgi:hypothetical protein